MAHAASVHDGDLWAILVSMILKRMDQPVVKNSLTSSGNGLAYFATVIFEVSIVEWSVVERQN